MDPSGTNSWTIASCAQVPRRPNSTAHPDSAEPASGPPYLADINVNAQAGGLCERAAARIAADALLRRLPAGARVQPRGESRLPHLALHHRSAASPASYCPASCPGHPRLARAVPGAVCQSRPLPRATARQALLLPAGVQGHGRRDAAAPAQGSESVAAPRHCLGARLLWSPRLKPIGGWARVPDLSRAGQLHG